MTSIRRLTCRGTHSLSGGHSRLPIACLYQGPTSLRRGVEPICCFFAAFGSGWDVSRWHGCRALFVAVVLVTSQPRIVITGTSDQAISTRLARCYSLTSRHATGLLLSRWSANHSTSRGRHPAKTTRPVNMSDMPKPGTTVFVQIRNLISKGMRGRLPTPMFMSDMAISGKEAQGPMRLL